jgi:hypothetical protein
MSGDEVVDAKAPPQETVKDGAGAIGGGRWFLTAPMYIIAWTIALYVAKCILFDKVIGGLALALCLGDAPKRPKDVPYTKCVELDRLFTTDDLGHNLTIVFVSVVGFYFGQAAIKEIISGLGNRSRKPPS